MRSIIRSGITAIALILCLSASFAVIAKGNLEKLKFKTSSVCDMCKSRIEKALKETEGVTEALVNLNKSEVNVKFDPAKTSAEKVKQVVLNTGYAVDGRNPDQAVAAKLPKCCQKSGSCAH
jgi:mercuric ion binding protein